MNRGAINPWLSREVPAWVTDALAVALALANALFWYWPSPRLLNGSGPDTTFNVWTFELVWKHLTRYGLLHVFSYEFWQAPILYPLKLGLALSENQLYPAILLYPLKRAIGNGTLVLGIGALLMDLAAFACMALWLRRLGAGRLASWGGLLFAACGWLQLQNRHYQNICLFLFPLALWSWERFRVRPSAGRLAAAAIFFGWICGWNLYFQMFANLILLLLVAIELRARKLPWLRLFALGVATLLVELPIAIRYRQLGASLGTLAVNDGVFRSFSASLLSVFASLPSFLQAHLPRYPAPDGVFEGAGFLGFAWLSCWGLALTQRRARPYALAALAAYLVALGPDFGVFYLIRFLPGFEGLRAIGRAQALVALFSIPALILYLRERTARVQAAVLGVICLELLPGAWPAKDVIPVTPGTPELATALSQMDDAGPLLILPWSSHQVQLMMLKTDSVSFGGFSGRELTNSFLLERQLFHAHLTEAELRAGLQFSRARRILSIEGEFSGWLRGLPFLRERGCHALYELKPCIFDVDWSRIERPGPLRLDRDASWSYPVPQPGSSLARLTATAPGVLDYDWLPRCFVHQQVRFPFGLSFSHEETLPFHEFRGFLFQSGDVVFEDFSRQAWFRLPPALRPEKRYEVRCR